MTPSTDITTTGSAELAAFGAIDPNSLAEIWADEMDGVDDLQFDRVKIPSGGGLVFQIPGDDPDRPESAEEIIGVVIDDHAVSALWLDAYTGENNPPDASSLDGRSQIVTDECLTKCRERGLPEPTSDLKTCPYNQWGSVALLGGDGNGKATKNMHRLYVLRPGETIPILVTLPPTSVKAWTNFKAKRIVGRGLRVPEVVVRLTLRQEKSNTGIPYSVAVPALVDRLPEDQAAGMVAYRESIRPLTRRVEVDGGEYDVPAPAASSDPIPPPPAAAPQPGIVPPTADVPEGAVAY